MSDKNPSRGEIWYVNLDPIIGHEEAKKRPCLILSNTKFNQSGAGIVVIAPLTSKSTENVFHQFLVKIKPPEGGVKEESFVMCDQLRAISLERLQGKILGKVDPETMNDVEAKLKTLLDFA